MEMPNSATLQSIGNQGPSLSEPSQHVPSSSEKNAASASCKRLVWPNTSGVWPWQPEASEWFKACWQLILSLEPMGGLTP